MLLFHRVVDVAPFTGAWIEIGCSRSSVSRRGVAPFTGAWIEISGDFGVTLAGGVSHPSRVRGLKLFALDMCAPQNKVAPFTGAWIEITRCSSMVVVIRHVAPFTGAWIEISGGSSGMSRTMTVAPFTGAWIEITQRP